MRAVRIVVIGIIGALALAPDVQALAFRVIPDDGFGARVLLIHDCQRIRNSTPCGPDEQGFVNGDQRRLAAKWSEGPFAEVWLISGGGSVRAGIDIANDLRRRGQAVRVPNAARLLKAGVEPTRPPACVSSCSIAFMGGQFRSIDILPGDAATYEVHAASAVMWGDPNEEKDYILSFFERLDKRGLDGVVAFLTNGDREMAAELFCVFQDTLWLTLKKPDPQDPERRRRDQVLRDWARERQGYNYPPAQFARDKAILALEGEASLQDILMRVERDSMMTAIAEMRALAGSLGRRADAALDMLAAMFDTSSILETNSVPRETLTKMGYLTEFVK